MSLDQILCFKHRRKVARDNTVKYNWRTLQLLPGKERPATPERSRSMRAWTVSFGYRGRRSPHRRRRRALEFSVPPMVLSVAPALSVGSTACHPKESLASLDAIEADSATERRRQSSQASGIATQETHAATEGPVEGRGRLSFACPQSPGSWGIHRNTVRKYAEAKSPPMMRTRGRSRVSQSDRMTAA